MDLDDEEAWDGGDATPWPTTSLGCAIPRSARGVDVQLAYGERDDGSIAHISEVPSGLVCNCICPSCKSRLVARKGAEKVHHFAHHGTLPCRYARESALHKLAKEVLNERRELLVPAVGAWKGRDSLITHEERIHRFDDAVLEHHLDTIVPDVIVRKGKHRLLVEMFVTHRCDIEKIRRIATLGIACLEVDLGSLSRDATRAEIEQALLSSADRWWVFNPKLGEAAERLEAQIAASQEAARIEAERRQAIEAKRIAAMEKKVLAARKLPRAGENALSPAAAFVIELGFDDLVGFTVEGDFCFQVSARAWQSEIIRDFVIPLLQQGQGYGFQTKAVFNRLKGAGVFRPDFPTYFDPAAERAMKARVPDFLSPYKIVELYLRHLESLHLLSRMGNLWTVGHNGRRKWSEYLERERRKEELLQSTRISVARMLKQLPEDERASFDIAAWMEERQPEFGVSFAQAIAGGSAAVSQLNFRLYQLEAMMLRNGDVVEDLMGLPLAAECERIRERKRLEREQARLAEIEAARRAREHRVQTLVTAAQQSLQADAAAWLDAPHVELEGKAPRALAESSSDGLDRVLARLAIDSRERLAGIERDRLQRRMLNLAGQMPKPDHARLFLNYPNPLWGDQRPIECCVDERTFDEVKRAMAAASK